MPWGNPFDDGPFVVGDVVEAAHWRSWAVTSVTVRGVIVETYTSHIDVDVSYASQDVEFYPGRSQYWSGNICRILRREVTKRLSPLEALGDAAP